MRLFVVELEGGVSRYATDEDDAQCCAFDRICERLSSDLRSTARVRYPDGRVMALTAVWVKGVGGVDVGPRGSGRTAVMS